MGTLTGAVVTGAGWGTGRVIAEEPGENGAVVVNYSRSKRSAEEVVASTSENGSGLGKAVQADGSDPGQAERLIGGTTGRFGRIDVPVDKTMKKLAVEDRDEGVRADLNSCYYTVKAALPHFVEQRSGKTVNTSSFVGGAGNFGQTNYAAAKAGIIGSQRPQL